MVEMMKGYGRRQDIELGKTKIWIEGGGTK